MRRERVLTDDDDFLDLDWVDAATPGAPLLLVLHGLEGSALSHYVGGLLAGARTRGWRGVALNFRSCSGELNRAPRFYHSGETGDLDFVVRHLQRREPALRIGAVGVSLGGNVLLKWLGELGAAVPPAIAGAVAISVPFDLVACARILDRGFRKHVYTASFLWTMRRKVRDKARRYPGFVDVAATQRCRTFAEYDRVVTAPLNGFADELDYWTRSSSGPYVSRIRRRTHLIAALDDPFVPPECLPDPRQLPPEVTAEYTPRGGHIGFVAGRWPWGVRGWAEQRAVAFLAPLLEDVRTATAGAAGT